MRWLTPLVIVALVASACGSSSDNTATDSSGNILDQGQKQAAQEQVQNTTTSAAGGEAPAAISSMADYEALWAEQRSAIVKEIVDNGWGWDQANNKVTGPGDFDVDLSKCAAGWDPYQGLENGTIKLGQTMAQSGIAADYGNIGTGQDIYFDYINTNGGITDSEGKTYQIKTTRRDDAYDPAKTVPMVDELLDSEGVFALETLGSPNTIKVYDKMNARCVPDPYVMSGHPAWGDPVNHPWTWGHQMAYNTEAILWGSLIEQQLADSDEINVAALIIQNDFGKAYELGFQDYIKNANKKINFSFERLEPTAAVVTNQMTTLAAQNPDVFIAMVGGTQCTQTIIEAANNGLKQSAKLLFQPSVCKGLNFVGKATVGGDGMASDGWWIVGGGGKDFNDPTNADDAWISFARDLLQKGGHPSEDSSQLGNGFAFGWPMVQALLIAAELPGGMSRPNFMIAARMLDMTNPNLLEGVKYNMRAGLDPYPTEGSEFSVFDGTGQTWVKDEKLGIIELSGESKPCAWDQSTSTCK
jgi:ABC-type branched-subunit amino acid transport system substrate-binding protein